MIGITVAILLALLATGARAGEQTKPFEGFTKYVKYHVRYEVNPDGTHVETHDWALKVLSDQGVSAANSASVSFSDRLQEAEILSAYTLKKDGRRIDVPASNFQEESNTGNGEASPMFSDIKTKTVAFPELAAGDTVVMSYKLTQKEALFPGHFSFLHVFSKFQVYDDVQIALDAPASLAIRVQARGVDGGEAVTKDGRRSWKWSYRNPKVAKPEQGAISTVDYGPLVIASTFADYGALAAAYDARARSKAEVTDRIKALAKEVTRHAKTPRAQAKWPGKFRSSPRPDLRTPPRRPRPNPFARRRHPRRQGSKHSHMRARSRRYCRAPRAIHRRCLNPHRRRLPAHSAVLPISCCLWRRNA